LSGFSTAKEECWLLAAGCWLLVGIFFCSPMQIFQAEAAFLVLANGNVVNNDSCHGCSPLIQIKKTHGVEA